MGQSYQIELKRVYDKPSSDDGTRVLVDRLWPRGIKKIDLGLDDWCKDASPSNALRKRFHQQSIDYETFVQQYFAELEAHPDSLTPLLTYARKGKLTLLSAVKTIECSHVPVLKHSIEQALKLEDFKGGDDCDD